MKTTTNKKVLAGMLVLGLGAAGAAVTAFANPYGYGPGHGGGGGMCWGYDGGASSSRWADVGQQRTAALRDRLNLNDAQEKAWRNYQDTVSANIKAMQDRELIDFSDMTAVERMERTQQLIKERDARMEKSLDALKSFYSTLTPEQKQVFDAETGGYQRGGRWHRGGMGPHY